MWWTHPEPHSTPVEQFLANCRLISKGAVGMISFITPRFSQQSNTGILVNQHITVQAAAEATGYNIQYLRR